MNSSGSVFRRIWAEDNLFLVAHVSFPFQEIGLEGSRASYLGTPVGGTRFNSWSALIRRGPVPCARSIVRRLEVRQR